MCIIVGTINNRESGTQNNSIRSDDSCGEHDNK